MDEQSGKSKKQEVMGEVIGELKNNEVIEEMKGVGSRDKVKHDERSDQLFLERMM